MAEDAVDFPIRPQTTTVPEFTIPCADMRHAEFDWLARSCTCCHLTFSHLSNLLLHRVRHHFNLVQSDALCPFCGQLHAWRQGLHFTVPLVQFANSLSDPTETQDHSFLEELQTLSNQNPRPTFFDYYAHLIGIGGIDQYINPPNPFPVAPAYEAIAFPDPFLSRWPYRRGRGRGQRGGRNVTDASLAVYELFGRGWYTQGGRGRPPRGGGRDRGRRARGRRARGRG